MTDMTKSNIAYTCAEDGQVRAWKLPGHSEPVSVEKSDKEKKKESKHERKARKEKKEERKKEKKEKDARFKPY